MLLNKILVAEKYFSTSHQLYVGYLLRRGRIGSLLHCAKWSFGETQCDTMDNKTHTKKLIVTVCCFNSEHLFKSCQFNSVNRGSRQMVLHEQKNAILEFMRRLAKFESECKTRSQQPG